MNKLDKIIKDFNFILTETVKIIDEEVSKKKEIIKDVKIMRDRVNELNNTK